MNEARASDGGGIGGAYSKNITHSYMATHTRKTGMREHDVDGGRIILGLFHNKVYSMAGRGSSDGSIDSCHVQSDGSMDPKI